MYINEIAINVVCEFKIYDKTKTQHFLKQQ